MRRIPFALLPLLLLAAVARAEDAEPSDPEAEAVMLRAHQARSGWETGFPGFSASVAATIDGDRVEGTVTVRPDGEVEVDLPAGPAAEWVQRQLASIAMHRTAGARDRYDVSFADGETDHPLGRLIRFHGGTTHSVYRIKDDVITEVHRQIEGQRFTISVTHTDRTPEGKTLTRHFNVSYWDAESGDLVSNDDFQDDWTRLGDFDLPARRLMIHTAKGQRQVSEFVLSDPRLLEAAAE